MEFIRKNKNYILLCVYFYISFMCGYFAYRFRESASVMGIFIVLCALSFIALIKRLFLVLSEKGVLSGLSGWIGKRLGRIIGFFSGKLSPDGKRGEGKLYIGGRDEVTYGVVRAGKQGIARPRLPKLKDMKTERQMARYRYVTLLVKQGRYRIPPQSTPGEIFADRGSPDTEKAVFDNYYPARYGCENEEAGTAITERAGEGY